MERARYYLDPLVAMTMSTWIELSETGPASFEMVGVEERKTFGALRGRGPGTARGYWASQGGGKKKVKGQDSAKKESEKDRGYLKGNDFVC